MALAWILLTPANVLTTPTLMTAYWISRSSKSGVESCANHLQMLVLPSFITYTMVTGTCLLSSILQNHKRTVENNLNVILDNNMAALAKKYRFCYHFWVPKDLFLLTTPPPGYYLNDSACWSMPKSKLSGLKAELYFMVPDNLRVHVTSYSNFSHVFSNAVGAERPNILKPVKDNALKLFAYLGLNTDLFANENSRAFCMHPKYFSKIIQVMVFGRVSLLASEEAVHRDEARNLGYLVPQLALLLSLQPL
ncbi:hypothetical protein EV401DRAFT_1890461 [Pisolithus croceorrhizus]|nr:hypothetical protein EV401DRAFT_1890461 [Pisolithus croceorrhizus]